MARSVGGAVRSAAPWHRRAAPRRAAARVRHDRPAPGLEAGEFERAERQRGGRGPVPAQHLGHVRQVEGRVGLGSVGPEVTRTKCDDGSVRYVGTACVELSVDQSEDESKGGVGHGRRVRMFYDEIIGWVGGLETFGCSHTCMGRSD